MRSGFRADLGFGSVPGGRVLKRYVYGAGLFLASLGPEIAWVLGLRAGGVVGTVDNTGDSDVVIDWIHEQGVRGSRLIIYMNAAASVQRMLMCSLPCRTCAWSGWLLDQVPHQTEAAVPLRASVDAMRVLCYKLCCACRTLHRTRRRHCYHRSCCGRHPRSGDTESCARTVGWHTANADRQDRVLLRLGRQPVNGYHCPD